MAGSVVSLLSSLFWLPLGFIGGILGITGASLMVCRCHHCISFALAVKVIVLSLQEFYSMMASLHIHHSIACLRGMCCRAAGHASAGEHLLGAFCIPCGCPAIRCIGHPLQQPGAQRQLLPSLDLHVCPSCYPAAHQLDLQLWYRCMTRRCGVCRLCILILWHCMHAVLSAAVSIHSSNIKRLIDPVKSGVILLRRPRNEQRQVEAEGADAERQV